MKVIRLELIETTAKHHPEGYLDTVLSRGKVVGDFLLMDDKAWAELDAQWSGPSACELVINFAESMRRWARAGFAFVDEKQFMERRGICLSCEHWDALAYLGLGKCRKCGCAKLKLHLASERCPIGKWP